MVEYWNDEMAPFEQINAWGGAHELQAPASSPSKNFFSLSLWLVA
jgi:hypothetical protein